MLRIFMSAMLLVALVQFGSTQTLTHSQYQQLARDILRELIEIKSTESGIGSTPAAEAVARRLLAAGFAPSDLQVIGPNERKKNLVARLHGKGADKPILIIGHLDVVEARKEDWSPDLDPFKLVEREGYFYGRGTQDIKGADALLVTNFIRWKQAGWVPSRDLLLALTADEEAYGDENGIAWLIKNHRDLIDAEYCMNVDSGDFQTKEGKPYVVTVAAGEKKETVLELEARNRGGHGSLPRKDNAIYELTAALEKIEKLQFPALMNDVTRAEFSGMASLESGPQSADLVAVSRNPADPAAIDRLSHDPYYNALLRTTCVATMLEAGHAPSALPQDAKAVINCRLIPGSTSEQVLHTLRQSIADNQVQIRWQFNEDLESLASPLRPDVFSAIDRVKDHLWPQAIVMAGLDTGGSDGRFLRVAGIPTYGLNAIFIEQGDNRMHGRDERVRVSDFYNGLTFYDEFFKTLVGSPNK